VQVCRRVVKWDRVQVLREIVVAVRSGINTTAILVRLRCLVGIERLVGVPCEQVASEPTNQRQAPLPCCSLGSSTSRDGWAPMSLPTLWHILCSCATRDFASRLEVVSATHCNMLLAAASYDLGKNDLTDLPIVQLSSELTCVCGCSKCKQKAWEEEWTDVLDQITN
jgi:hypothetical protein